MAPQYSQLFTGSVPKQQCLTAIIQRRAVFWIGAGASKEAGLPTAIELADYARRRLDVGMEEALRRWEQENGQSAGIEHIAQLYLERDKHQRHFIQDCIPVAEWRVTPPARFHYLLAELAAEGYIGHLITTNVDQLIERALEEKGVQHDPVVRPEDIRNSNRPRVYKVNGCLSNEDSQVWAYSMLKDPDWHNRWAEVMVPALLLQTDVIVFIGFTTHLAYFAQTWTRIRERLQGSPPTAFIVAPDDFASLRGRCGDFLELLKVTEDHHFQCNAGKFIAAVRQAAHANAWKTVGMDRTDDRLRQQLRGRPGTILEACRKAVSELVENIRTLPAEATQQLLRRSLLYPPERPYLPLKDTGEPLGRWLEYLSMLGIAYRLEAEAVEGDVRIHLRVDNDGRQPLWAVDAQTLVLKAIAMRTFEDRLRQDTAWQRHLGIDHPGGRLLTVLTGASGEAAPKPERTLTGPHPQSDLLGRDPASVARITGPAVCWLSQDELEKELFEAKDEAQLRTGVKKCVQKALDSSPNGSDSL